ncbi:MAG TPA: hypothetical protein VK178_04455 [Opitutaceae bacterium]|nr:hypothetical protein [Opitutaceae bacterium]
MKATSPSAPSAAPARGSNIRILSTSDETRRRRILVVALVALPPLAVLLLLPPLAQNPAYHAFADQRSWHGLPHALDVLTNLPFLLAGLLGLREALHQPATPLRAAWLAFFGGVSLVALGSGYYHLAPVDASLVWDRLPMTFAFTSLFAAVLGETIDPLLGRRALYPALLGGVLSVFWWQRHGDLRPYFAVQLLALVGVPILLAAFRRRGAGRSWLIAGLGCYALAFAAEQSDGALYTFTGGIVSGHSLKHYFAALACAAVAAMLRSRRPVVTVLP